MPNLEDVFKLSGVPTFTYVTPDKYNQIKVAIRTAGRCVVLEGPSGIGKTTIVTKVLEELQLSSNPTILSARRPADLEIIDELANISDFGVVIIDDFHRLADKRKAALSDFMKVLADTADETRQLVLIGINKAGDPLIDYGYDLGLRIDIFRLEANSPERIMELMRLGEHALNVAITHKEAIAERAEGSFQIAQLLCHKLCASAGITESSESNVQINGSIESVIEDVMADLGRQFRRPAIAFARGTKLRREGRAPYLHILKWLSENDEGALDLREAMNAHKDMKGSVGQVVDKGFLAGLLSDPEKQAMLGNILFYDEATAVLGVEDPKFMFFLNNLVWRAFTKQCGFSGDYFKGKYDFALSFAGNDRAIAESLANELVNREINVFYDFEEQHKILGQNVEDYLAPIYRSEARYVVPFLTKDYPRRIWTKFESDQFRDRFGEGTVFPVRFRDVEEGWFSEQAKYGGLMFDRGRDLDVEIGLIADILAKRLIEDREKAEMIDTAEAEIIDSAEL